MVRRPDDLVARDDDLHLASEPSMGPDGAERRRPWKLLVVDDEEDVHLVTRLVLRDFRFEGAPVQLLSAYSGVAARRELRRNPDIAVVLLDVVMEREDAGLQLVRHIRQDMGNRLVRIILRTGQPGQAPEQEVVAQYDINDYRSKTELTAARLRTTVTSALRAWRDLCALADSRDGLRQVIRSQAALFRCKTREDFAAGVLDGLVRVAVPARSDGDGAGVDGLVARSDGGGHRVVVGRGRYSGCEGRLLHAVLTPRDLRMAREVDVRDRSLFYNNSWVGSCRCDNGGAMLLHLKADGSRGPLAQDLVRISMAGVTMAFRNANLSQEIIAAQKEMIHTLGEVVETRSRETAHHVLRVGEMAALLGGLAGLDAEDVALLELAAPMHDVGKVGIPDAILNKPGRLTTEEYRVMQRHTSIGHAILAKSHRRIMQAAAVIALQHHERWDGTGYPAGLAGEEIHIHGRITALVDVFDALISRRVYRAACPLDEVVGVVRSGRGSHFDPGLVDLFLANLPVFRAVVQGHPDEAKCDASLSARA